MEERLLTFALAALLSLIGMVAVLLQPYVAQVSGLVQPVSEYVQFGVAGLLGFVAIVSMVLSFLSIRRVSNDHVTSTKDLSRSIDGLKDAMLASSAAELEFFKNQAGMSRKHTRQIKQLDQDVTELQDDAQEDS